MKDKIYIAIFIILITILCIGRIQYSELENNYNLLKIENTKKDSIIQDLENKNNTAYITIDSLNNQLIINNKNTEILIKDKEILENKLDSFTFIKDLNQSGLLLKYNLSCEYLRY